MRIYVKQSKVARWSENLSTLTITKTLYLFTIILQPDETWEEGECLLCKCKNGMKKCGRQCKIQNCPHVREKYELSSINIFF